MEDYRYLMNKLGKFSLSQRVRVLMQISHKNVILQIKCNIYSESVGIVGRVCHCFFLLCVAIPIFKYIDD